MTRWMLLSVVVALAACASDDVGEDRGDESDPGRDAGELDFANSTQSEPNDRSTTAEPRDPNCVPGGYISDEFVVPACEDSSVPSVPCVAGVDEFGQPVCLDGGVPDAGTAEPPIVTDTPGVDAGTEQPPTIVREEGMCDGWVVQYEQPSCSDPGHYWDPPSITCEIVGGRLLVRGDLCETCGTGDRFLNELGIEVADCNNCTIGGGVWGANPSIHDNAFAPNTCKSSLDVATRISYPVENFINSPNRGDAAGTPLDCVRVFALSHSSDEAACDAECQAESRSLPGWSANPGTLACRCDPTAGTCISCADGACD